MSNIWQISPGHTEDLWPDFHDEGVIAIGFYGEGSLEEFSSKDELAETTGLGKNGANTCWSFSHEIQENDIIVAKKGNSKEVYGIGKVVKKNGKIYEFQEEREHYKHIIHVTWYVNFPDHFEVAKLQTQFVQYTVETLPEDRFKIIVDSILEEKPELKNALAEFLGKFQGYTKDSFEFLKELKINSNKQWMDLNRGRYEDLRDRTKDLIEDLGTKYIALNYPALETNVGSNHCLSRINRQRPTPEGDIYYNYLWGAFYRKSIGNKSQDFQLFITIHDTFFEMGIYFGHNVKESFKDIFRNKVREQKNEFITLAQQLPDEYKFQLIRDVGSHDTLPEDIRIENEDILEKWLQSPNLQIVRTYDENDPLVLSPKLVESVIDDFKKLDPIYRFIWTAYEAIPESIQTLVDIEEIVHLVYKIAWHPGDYKGKFCGKADSEACEAFNYVKQHKQEEPCAPDVYHCVDEHEAFADTGWKVNVHPPQQRSLFQLTDGRSIIFLIAPLDKYKNTYRLVGFYLLKQKIVDNNKVMGFEAEKVSSSKFDLEADELTFTNDETKELFDLERWPARRTYEYITDETALKVLTKMYELHDNKEIHDPDINLRAIQDAIELLQGKDVLTLQGKVEPITLQDYLVSKKFLFESGTISAFYAALKTKGFVILAGLTGTGKTKLPQLFNELVAEKEHRLFLSVRPDWRDSKPLLGYFNPIERSDEQIPIYEAKELLLHIMKSVDNFKSEPKQPFFVILDEMNLARVEYYFSDFLSVLESGRQQEEGETKGYSEEPLHLHTLDTCVTRKNNLKIKPDIHLPPNLYFVGTVNLDETTFSFSPKMLDRAFVLEFWKVDLDNYPPDDKVEINYPSKRELKEKIITDLSRENQFINYSKETKNRAIDSLGTYYNDIKILHSILKLYDLHFGYRVIDEIGLFYVNAVKSWEKNIIQFTSKKQIIDYAILMKVLPKFHGNASKMEIPLRKTLAWAISPEKWKEIVDASQDDKEVLKDAYKEKIREGPQALFSKFTEDHQIKYQKTADKIARMMYQLYITGYTCYL